MNVTLTTDAGSEFEIFLAESDIDNPKVYIKLYGKNLWLQYSESGSGYRFWTDRAKDKNARVAIKYENTENISLENNILEQNNSENNDLVQIINNISRGKKIII